MGRGAAPRLPHVLGAPRWFSCGSMGMGESPARAGNSPVERGAGIQLRSQQQDRAPGARPGLRGRGQGGRHCCLPAHASSTVQAGLFPCVCCCSGMRRGRGSVMLDIPQALLSLTEPPCRIATGTPVCRWVHVHPCRCAGSDAAPSARRGGSGDLHRNRTPELLC